MKLGDIAINVEKLEQGDWVSDPPEMEGLRLKVRGLNNADFRKLQSKLMDAVPRQKRIRGIDPEERDRITGECLLNTVLLDWDGLMDGDNKPIPYSKDFARTLLFEPTYQRFREGVIWAAAIVANEEAEAAKADLGN